MFEVLCGLNFLQVKKLTFEQTEEVPCHCIVQTVSLAVHTLPDTLFLEHKHWYCQPWSEWKVNPIPSGIVSKALGEHGCHHNLNRSVRNGIAD